MAETTPPRVVPLEEHFNQPESQFDEISEWFAGKLFDKITLGETCGGLEIPFRYVEAGCVSRAHEMCRIILEEGVRPIKVWTFDSSQRLTVETDNYPDCQIKWSYHVAPAVKTPSGLKVIDPALFDQPVPLQTWLDRQVSCSKKVLYTGPHIYLLLDSFSPFLADPDYSRTHKGIRELQKNFKLFVDENGPPPYKKCRSKYA